MAHIYCRVFVVANSSFNPAMEELEFYDAAGSYLATGGTAFSSSNESGITADNGFDRDFGTYWAPSGGVGPHPADEWLGYNFGSPVTVATVRITDRETLAQGPASVLVQVSNTGSGWTNVAGPFTPRYGNDASNHSNCWSFAVATPAAGFFVNWRVRATGGPQSGGGSEVRCAELALRDTVGGANLASASPYQYVLGVAGGPNAFDGDPSTYAILDAPGSPTGDASWVGYAFPKPVKILQVCWQMPSSGGAFSNSGPTTIAVEGSNDGGMTWTTAWTETFGTWTADGQQQCVGASLVVTCDSPPDGTVGTSYSHAFPASNGTEPYTFSVLADTLPPGLSIDPATGIVSGIPTLSGTFAFVVDVSDSAAGAASVSCSITIAGMTLGCGATPNGLVGVAYEDQLVVSSGVPPYVFTLLSGTLPPGLTLNPTTGEITGTPTTPGTYCFTVQVTEGAPAPGSGGFVNQVTVNVVHGLNSTSVSPGVWDDSGDVIKFGTVKLTDANNAVLTFPTPQSGSFKLSADTFQQGFLGATSVNVPHGLNSLNLIPVVYDSANNVIDFDTFELIDVNNAVLTFATAQGGNLVILLPTGAYSQTFAPASSIPVPHNLNSTLLRVAVYDTSDNLIAYESFGPVDVNNSVLTFPAGSPQAGRVVVRVP